MRLDNNQKFFIVDHWQKNDVKNKIYLFGSRTDDKLKGGDIDILIMSENKINHFEIFKMKTAFYQQFGEQKIDVVNLTFNTNSAFKDHLLSYAKLLINE